MWPNWFKNTVFAEDQVVKLTLQTLKNMRSADSFDLFLGLVEKACQQFGTDGPILHCKQKALKHLEVGSTGGYITITTSVQGHYCQL